MLLSIGAETSNAEVNPSFEREPWLDIAKRRSWSNVRFNDLLGGRITLAARSRLFNAFKEFIVLLSGDHASAKKVPNAFRALQGICTILGLFASYRL